MPTLDNPAEKLGPIVSGLYELAGNSQVPQDQRQALLLQAHDLRGDLVGLVAMQFTNNTGAYQQVMSNLSSVTSALDQAEKDIQRIVQVVNGAAQLAKSIDGLLKEAMKVVETIR